MSARDLDVSENSVRQGGPAYPSKCFQPFLVSPKCSLSTIPPLPLLPDDETKTITTNSYVVLISCQALLLRFLLIFTSHNDTMR